MAQGALDELSRRYVPLVDSYIQELLRGAPEELYRASMHLIKAGGKRLRPLVVLASARALGGPEAEERALPLAAAVEVFHNFTLVHDDIMDNDDYRRGVPTVHKVYGIPMAITAGDLMFAKSFAAILMSRSAGLDSAWVVRAIEVLAEAARKVAEGQAYDMLFERTWDVDENDYLKMIYLKTGALIEASAMLGAIAAKAKDEVIATMGDVGRLVGLAFQIRDDLLGIYGDPARTGKPVYSDLRRGKKTILVIYAAARSKELRERLSEVFAGKYTEEVLREVADEIEKVGARKYAESLSLSYAELAIEKLEGLRRAGHVVDDVGYQALRELAEFSAKRDR